MQMRRSKNIPRGAQVGLWSDVIVTEKVEWRECSIEDGLFLAQMMRDGGVHVCVWKWGKK
jgi:hypothetical protein